MRELLNELRSILDLQKVQAEDRGAVTQMLVGEALGNGLEIPSSPVDNPVQYFRLTHRDRVLETLSEVNEHLIIDIDQTADLAYKLWITRYRMVHEAGSAVTKRLMKTIMCMGGFEIPPHYAQLGAKYPDAHAHRYLIESAKEIRDE